MMKNIIITCSAQHRFTPTRPQLKLCKDCKHFQPSQKVKYGKCSLYGFQDLVDGSIKYEFAGIARQYECKGQYFKDAKEKAIMPQDVYWMSVLELDPPRTYDK